MTTPPTKTQKKPWIQQQWNNKQQMDIFECIYQNKGMLQLSQNLSTWD